jgi:hypothetical protein
MQKVFYPGHAGQPCIGEYAIVLDQSGVLPSADIVLVSRQSHRGPSFQDSNTGRNLVLNRILTSDLRGIRLEWLRLFLLVERTASAPGLGPEFFGRELRIDLDTDDFIARGNRCSVKRSNILARLFTGVSYCVSYWSRSVVGGCADVTSSLWDSRELDRQEIRALCQRVGIDTGTPNGPFGHRPRAATPNTLSSTSYH